MNTNRRSIKFRGKRISDGDWMIGDLVTVVNGDFATERTFIHLRLSDVGFTQDGLTSQLCLHEVDPETVGQYTGLKDRNGKEIYEGDIGYVVIDRYGDPRKPFLSVVECDRCFWSFRHLERNDLHEIWPKDQFEVIGNIYENPNLLEG